MTRPGPEPKIDPSDVDMLLAAGYSPELITSRLATSAAALARSMRRQHRPDLARLFEHADHTQRRDQINAAKRARKAADPEKYRARQRLYDQRRRRGGARPTPADETRKTA